MLDIKSKIWDAFNFCIFFISNKFIVVIPVTNKEVETKTTLNSIG